MTETVEVPKLYVIARSRGHRVTKIGLTYRDIDKRLRQLQTGNGHKLKIFAAYEMPDQETATRFEWEIISDLKTDAKTVGEWVSKTPLEVIEAIEAKMFREHLKIKKVHHGPQWGGARHHKSEEAPITPASPAPTSIMSETVPAEPKDKVDPNRWMEMLPQITEVFERYSQRVERTRDNSPFRLPDFPKAAVPATMSMAMDSALMGNLSFCSDAWAAGGSFDNFPGDGNGFLGYSFLSALAQRPEYRVMAETIADDATREWIDFDVVGDEKANQEEAEKDPEGFAERMADPDEKRKRVKEAGKTDKVKALQDDQLRLEVAHRFHAQSRNNGFFGRSHLLLDIWTNNIEPTADEMKTAIGTGVADDAVSRSKVTPGSFKRLQTIEPVWTYPLAYNAWDPTRADWYNPQVWFVMGKEFHGSRLQTFIAHPVPDMLKPAYAFGGISLSEMAKPYVDIWLQTRSSVAQLIHSFSVMVLKTDLSTLLNNNNAAQMLSRVAMFNMMRDNANTYVINEATEDFANVSAPLSGLHELQAQAQEHMASVHRIPLVKFTGIQPSGLNASSEGEIKTYDDTIAAYQKRVLDPNLRRIINFEQLSLWGEIDPEITFTWKPLREMTLAEKGQKEKDDADRNQKYVDMGALAPGEIRKAIIEDPDLPYTGLDPDDVPEPPAEEGLLGPGAGGSATEFEKEADGQGGEGGGANDAAGPFGATDEASFEESKHPRAPDGKFTSGGGGGGSTPAFKSKKEHAAHLLTKGTTTQEMLAALNWPTISMPQMAKTLGMKLEKTKEGGVTKYKGVKMTPEELAAAKAEAAKSKPEPQKVEIKQEPPKAPAPPPATKHGPATAGELEKAKKNVPLKIQYVPGAPQDSLKAQGLVNEFNAKWLNKTTPDKLQEKVNDFKDLVEAMKPLQSEQQKAAAAKLEAEKAQAAAHAKALADKAVALAKEKAEKNKKYIKELGISETQAEGFDALAKMMGKADLVEDFQKYAKEAEAYGYPISGFECALIKNYSDGGFGQVNAALRSDKWTPAQHVYVAMVNKALKSMPSYQGEPLIRNTNLSQEQIAYYAEGHIIQEKALMSTSKKKPNGVFSGNVRFVVTPTKGSSRAADIKKLSVHGGEDEVVFAGRTYFKVGKVEKLSQALSTGATTVIHLEEWHEL
jgi:hypothetical protein